MDEMRAEVQPPLGGVLGRPRLSRMWKEMWIGHERRQVPGVVRIRRRVLFRAEALLDWVDQKSAPSPKAVERDC